MGSWPLQNISAPLMESNIFFSVIVPTYNRAELLKKTIRSFLDQRFPGFEMIIVDDGGKDNSKEIVESFHDPRIRYYWKENAERGAARNYGAALARGQWVNFFDSDDLAYPNHLETAHTYVLNEPGAKVFHTSYDWKDMDTGKVFQLSVFTGELNPRIRNKNCLSCNNVFIEKATAAQYRFSETRDLSGSEDWLLWLRLSESFSIKGLADITSSIMQHGERSMIVASGKSTELRTRAMIEAIRRDENQRLHSLILSVSAEMFSLASLHYAFERNFHATFRTFRYAVSSKPSILFTRRALAILKYLFFKRKRK